MKTLTEFFDKYDDGRSKSFFVYAAHYYLWIDYWKPKDSLTALVVH